jgi:pimeloyl-ACP methyl ester carboxylesterase
MSQGSARRIAATVTAVVAVTTLAVGPGAGASPMAASSANGATLEWAPCTTDALRDSGLECARLSVPMDRESPGGRQFSLALVRHPSTGTAADRIGSLVFNPGGPGGSGLDAVAWTWAVLPDEVRQRFDLVTWDPRGVGASTPALVGCDTPWPDRPATGPVDWAQVVADYRRALTAANRECQQRNAAIIGQLGTVENVEDLDRIRAALGEERLSFWGMSYGTRIGYVYALAHPDRIRALVLDGSIDPAATTRSLAQGGAAPDQAYGPFADVYPAADRQLREVLATLDERPLPLPDGTSLTRWDVRDLVYGQVAQQSAYSFIAEAAGRWHTAIFGSGQQQEAAVQWTMAIRKAVAALPNSNAGGMFSVVNCLDYAGRPTLAQAIGAVRYEDRIGPEYGASLAAMYALGCSGLRVDPDPIPVITGSGPRIGVLVLGATRDGSTIVQWTARMSRAFPESRTVTYAGGQHVTWGLAGSQCVNAIADDYVINGRLPATDRACPNAVPPAS